MLKPIHNTNRWVFDGLQVLGVNRQAVIYNRFSAEMTSVKPVVAAGLMMVFKHQLHSHWTQCQEQCCHDQVLEQPDSVPPHCPGTETRCEKERDHTHKETHRLTDWLSASSIQAKHRHTDTDTIRYLRRHTPFLLVVSAETTDYNTEIDFPMLRFRTG